MSLKRKKSPELPAETSTDTNLFWSSAIEDRSSRFIGVYSPTLKPKELQNIEEINTASHKILGWRRESNQQSINKSKQYVTGFDDDGEKYGGKKVEKVLQETQVSGSCVVARWWGGVMLGPVRFAHIENCAREAIRNWQEQETRKAQKRKKDLDDASKVVDLVKVLSARDQSISVLRALAAEKERSIHTLKSKDLQDATGDDGADPKPEAASRTTPAMDYSIMPLDRLKALEKARDATLSFLLKRIDKAEAELKSLEPTTNTSA